MPIVPSHPVMHSFALAAVAGVALRVLLPDVQPQPATSPPPRDVVRTATPPADPPSSSSHDKAAAAAKPAAPADRAAPPRVPVRGADASKKARAATAAPPSTGSVQSLSRADASRPLSPEQTAALVAVAKDISPEWADWIRERSERDPQALRAAIQNHGRRLVALAVLREQSPDLYELKVAELRLQAEVGDVAKRYGEAVAAGRTEEAEKLYAELRTKAAQQVDKSLKTRAAELKALDEQMKAIDQKVRSFRDELMEDTKNRDARIAEVLKGVTSGAALGPIKPPPGESPRPSEKPADKPAEQGPPKP